MEKINFIKQAFKTKLRIQKEFLLSYKEQKHILFHPGFHHTAVFIISVSGLYFRSRPYSYPQTILTKLNTIILLFRDTAVV